MMRRDVRLGLNLIVDSSLTPFVSLDRRGNRVLIGICCMNLILFPLVKLYYIKRNQYKRKIWESLSPEQQSEYLDTTQERGSKRLDFQFFH